jgi:hypothetical protein
MIFRLSAFSDVHPESRYEGPLFSPSSPAALCC